MRADRHGDRHTGRRLVRVWFLTAALALFCVLALAQLSAAAQTDSKPTPPAGSDQRPSPYARIVPTDEELLAMPAGIERYLAAHTLPAGTLRPANLNGSSKTASDDLVSPGGVFQYTIQVQNSGEFDIPVEVTDNLPNQVTYIDSECVAFITDKCEFSQGAVQWKGTVTEGGSATVTITVRLNSNAQAGAQVQNTAQIKSAEQNINRSATITVDEAKASPIQFVPFTIKGLMPDPGPVTLTTGLPNSQNSWTLNWTASPGASGYEIHEAQEPDFADATPVFVGQQTALTITKAPSPFNVYYYRVRSLVGEKTGPWSNIGEVIGGYRDDFDDPNTGWSMRRSTYLEAVKGFYENGRYVMQVNSRWDWGISSPLQPAPRVPYVIEFEARAVSQAYAHSFGGVFAGDWMGATCPPGTSFDEWYRHSNCFNHFYNTNTIYNDTNPSDVRLQLLFERVDKLVWCLDCGGSPMKRTGDNTGLQNVTGVDEKEWNRYRIEVRADGIKVFAGRPDEDPRLQLEYGDTRWIGDPYFGVFASTDVIENATWRFEYFQVMPLD